MPCNDHNCDLKRSRDVERKGILFTKPACLFDVAVTGAVENENPIVNSMIQIVLVNVNYEWPKEKKGEREKITDSVLIPFSSTEVTFGKRIPKRCLCRFSETIKDVDKHPAPNRPLLNKRSKVRLFGEHRLAEQFLRFIIFYDHFSARLFEFSLRRCRRFPRGGGGSVNRRARKTRLVGRRRPSRRIAVEETRDALTNCRATGMVIR